MDDNSTIEASQSIRLGVLATHPVHYFSPLYSDLASKFPNFQVAFISDATEVAKGIYDKDFGKHIAWDSPLLNGFEWSDFKMPWPMGLVGMVRNKYKYRKALNIWYKSFRPDVVMIPGWATHYQIAATFFHSKRVPIVVRPEARVPEWSGWVRNNLRDKWRRNVIAKASSGAFIGEAARDELLRLGMTPGQLFSSPYAVENFANTDNTIATQERDIQRAQIGVSSTDFLFIYVGKFVDYKKVDSTVKLFAEVCRDDAQLKLLLVGDGPLKSTLQILIKDLDLEDQIFIHGFANQSELHRLYASSDAFILLSDETWGLVVNEALQANLPVAVARSVGSSRDLVLNNLTGTKIDIAHTDIATKQLQEFVELAKKTAFAGVTFDYINNFSVAAAAKGITDAVIWAAKNSVKTKY